MAGFPFHYINSSFSPEPHALTVNTSLVLELILTRVAKASYISIMYPALILMPIILYLGGYFIDFDELRENKVSILLAITVGAVTKILFVGFVLQFIHPGIESWILATIVGQIDPGAMLFFRNLRPFELSKKYTAISGSMSAFDDPATALIALSIIPAVIQLPSDIGLAHYGMSFFMLGLFVFFGFFIFTKSKALVVFSFLSVSFLTRVALSAGILGLLIKPKTIFGKFSFAVLADRAVPILFFASLILVVVSIRTVPTATEIYIGICTGILVFISQILTALWVGTITGLKKIELGYLALDQFNGITSSTLALHFSLFFPSVIPITFISILTIMMVYVVSNSIFSLVIAPSKYLSWAIPISLNSIHFHQYDSLPNSGYLLLESSI